MCVPAASRFKGVTEWDLIGFFVMFFAKTGLFQASLGAALALLISPLTVKLSRASSHSLDGVWKELASAWLSSSKEAALKTGDLGMVCGWAQSRLLHAPGVRIFPGDTEKRQTY